MNKYKVLYAYQKGHTVDDGTYDYCTAKAKCTKDGDMVVEIIAKAKTCIIIEEVE